MLRTLCQNYLYADTAYYKQLTCSVLLMVVLALLGFTWHLHERNAYIRSTAFDLESEFAGAMSFIEQTGTVDAKLIAHSDLNSIAEQFNVDTLQKDNNILFYGSAPRLVQVAALVAEHYYPVKSFSFSRVGYKTMLVFSL